MSFFKNLKLKARLIKRLGAYSHALEQGLSPEDARAYANKIFPMNEDDIAFEKQEREKGVIGG